MIDFAYSEEEDFVIKPCYTIPTNDTHASQSTVTNNRTQQ